MSTTLGSNCGSGAMNWITSCPDFAAISDATRAGMPVTSM
jgi:hypothetical protein